jgi:hypothetical protein
MLLLTFAAINQKRDKDHERYAALLPLIEKNKAAVDLIVAFQKSYPDMNEDLVRSLEKMPEIAKIVDDAKLKDKESPTLADVLKKLAEEERARKEALASGKDLSQEDQLKQALAELQKLRDEAQKLENQKSDLISQLTGEGKGFDYPPCWYEPGGSKRPEYIFNIDLTNKGITVFENSIEHREEEKKQLPIQSIQYKTPLSIDAFRNQTSGLYAWSQKNQCRFYVNVYDKTGSDQKELFKRLLVNGVESHFYKFLSSDRFVAKKDSQPSKKSNNSSFFDFFKGAKNSNSRFQE